MPLLPDEFDQTLLSLAEGDFLCDRYRLIRLIGRGGMGTVWLARDTRLEEDVAVKLLNTALSRDQRAIARLREEARRNLKLTHPHIVRLINFEQDTARGDTAFLVMQYIDGQTLNDLLADHPKGIAVQRVRKWAEQITGAIDFAHQKNIIHRDIKPSNIIIDGDDNAYLMDFGIARELLDTMTRVTGMQDSSGTLPYMSPQQLRGENHPSNDIYSFAATLYEALSGEPPFVTGDLAYQICHTPPKPIVGVSDVINDGLRLGLAKEPHERPKSACAMFPLDTDAALRLADLAGIHASEAPSTESHKSYNRTTKSPLTAEQLEEFRELLIEKRRQLVGDVTSMEREALGGNSGSLSRLSQHMADQGSDVFDQTLNLDLAVYQRRFLAEIDDAIDRIDDGTYGICELFGIPIGLERLRNTPWARLSIKAAPQIEFNPAARQQRERDLLQRARSPKSPPGVTGANAAMSYTPSSSERRAGDREVITLPGTNVEMAFRWCPPGKFRIGRSWFEGGELDEIPARKVRFRAGFWLGETPVTQAQWQAVMGNNPSHFKGDDRPVESVSWNDAQEFIKKLRERGLQVRLPSEAEWEYACRAGTTTPFHFGAMISTDQANYDGNYGNYTYGNGRKGVYRNGTTPVRLFFPNNLGLYDMHGNVWEWCTDVWHDYYTGAPTDGSAWTEGGDQSRRVLRGGSWFSNPNNCRSANRYWLTPGYRDYRNGFRLALDPN